MKFLEFVLACIGIYVILTSVYEAGKNKGRKNGE